MMHTVFEGAATGEKLKSELQSLSSKGRISMVFFSDLFLIEECNW